MAAANVVHLLAKTAARVPDRPALIDRGRVLTFARLWERVDRAAAGLRRKGITAGDRVVVFAPPSPDLYVALLAVWKLGAACVFLDPRVDPAGIAAIVSPRAFLGSWKALAWRWIVPDLRAIGVVARVGSRWLERRPGDGAITPVAGDDVALVSSTGGSGGTPKGVTRTHGILRAQHAALAAAFPLRDDDVDLTTMPVFVLRNLAAGIPSVLPRLDLRHVDRFRADRVAADFARCGVTTCTASPAFLDRLLDAEPPRLRRILTGGAPVDDGQLRRWRAAWPAAEIQVVYGSTEAEPVAHIEADARLAAQGVGVCLGRPVPDVAVRLAASAPAELLVAGAHVCRDYLGNPAAVAAYKVHDADGCVWHRMGDVVYRDGAGRLWLVGRVHNTIRRAGEALYAHVLEQAARGNDPRIRRVAAVGRPDPVLRERVVLVVECDGAGEVAPADVRRRVGAAGLPVDDVVISGRPLPVDPRHRSKIDYARLRRRLGRAG